MTSRDLTYREYALFLQKDLTTFIERSFYELNPHQQLRSHPYIDAIAAKLEDCRLGKTKRLIINLPPRHLKSHCTSIAFVAWLLGHNPSEKIICASYGQDLASKLARDCRSVIAAPWYQRIFPTRLSDRQASDDFETTEQGGRMATSVEGVLTGRGANFIIIDDPLKPDDALSETRRTKVNEWFDGTLLSRLNDKMTGCIIIVMQRLHQDDLVGHVLEQENWEVLSFPAIADQEETWDIRTPLGWYQHHRSLGDILDPRREDQATLARLRKSLGEYYFSAQYQQNPMPKGGAMVKHEWIQYYSPDSLPKTFDRFVLSWDTANKANEINDYSVCTVWGVHNRHFYLLTVYRARLNYPDLKRKAVELSKRYSTPTTLIEDKASGTQLIQELSRDMYGVKGYEPPAGTDKLMRFHAQTDLFENGYVHLPVSAPWLQDYVTEITSFPGTRFDDQVDSTAQALDFMRSLSSLEIWAKLGQGGPFPGIGYDSRFVFPRRLFT